MSQQESQTGFWIRCVAVSIDSLLLTLLTFPFLRLPSDASGGDMTEVLPVHGLSRLFRTIDFIVNSVVTYHIAWFRAEVNAGWVHFLALGLLPIVAVILFWRFWSATPGKMLCGTRRIVDADTGGTLSTMQCILRYLGYLISTIPLCLGFAWVAFDGRKQGFHDKLAHTVVVRRRRKPASSKDVLPIDPLDRYRQLRAR
ncbi:MAG: RDD family protein [Candidatus Hydrogenedentes bacterium]|nr:RDD family protein [Candidatus Hydrogenedentota bacterium]